MSPATSSPRGAATTADTPRRAAPTAVIAPPPGERKSSAAKRSSPRAGSDSSPTNVRSRKTGVATTSSVTAERGYPGRGSRDQGPDGIAGELRLADEAARAGVGDQRAEVGAVAAGGEDDRARSAGCVETRCDLEAVDVRQPDVEQDDVRREAERLAHTGLAVGGDAHDVEALRLEQQSGCGEEGRVVVDDEDRLRHRRHANDYRRRNGSRVRRRRSPRRSRGRSPRTGEGP